MQHSIDIICTSYNCVSSKFVFQGSNVRIDTTLLGFDNMSWQRGSRSFLFKGEGLYL